MQGEIMFNFCGDEKEGVLVVEWRGQTDGFQQSGTKCNIRMETSTRLYAVYDVFHLHG
jgi:hypothetical protein